MVFAHNFLDLQTTKVAYDNNKGMTATDREVIFVDAFKKLGLHILASDDVFPVAGRVGGTTNMEYRLFWSSYVIQTNTASDLRRWFG